MLGYSNPVGGWALIIFGAVFAIYGVGGKAKVEVGRSIFTFSGMGGIALMIVGALLL